MTTLNNIERLIQMATIEQMYEMLQKMKCDARCDKPELFNKFNDARFNNTMFNDTSFNDTRFNDTMFNDTNSKLTELFTIINSLQTKCDNLCINAQTNQNSLILKISMLETQLQEVTNNSIQTTKCEYLIAGQQKITKYPGFNSSETVFKPIVNKEEHITLHIEEKLDIKNDTVVDVEVEDLVNATLVDQISKDLRDCEIITNLNIQNLGDQEKNRQVNTSYYDTRLDEEAVVEEAVVEEEELTEEEEEEADKEEEEEEEEADTEEEEEEEEADTEEEEEEEEEADTEEEEEANAEEEEVFEIEIDDVTYFATNEENGILYEVDKNGDVGKKVGIIKDGEPIFS